MPVQHEDGAAPWSLWPFDEAPTALRELFEQRGMAIVELPRFHHQTGKLMFGKLWAEEWQGSERIVVLLTWPAFIPAN